jgi:hypothetical protein
MHAATDAIDNRVAYHFAAALLKARGLDQSERSEIKMAVNAT